MVVLVKGGDKDNAGRNSPMAPQAEEWCVCCLSCVCVCGTRSALTELLLLSFERCRHTLRLRNVRFWIIGMFAAA